MYYNEDQAALIGQKNALRYGIDLLSFDLQNAWRVYSRKGEQVYKQRWLSLLREYNKLAAQYQKIESALEDAGLSIEAE